ncbi:MAG: GreA/GreB family elongation factor [Candidatus Methylopumilus sp.]|nr:GreA/GreB family elongation factor [Candidatus Methylopumilus sp.]
MSRGFVKEDDLELAGTDLLERPISELPNYVTPNGLKQLKAIEGDLLNERELLAPKKEDPTAVQKLAMVDRDLRYVQSRLEQAILVETPNNETPSSVVFGTTVTVEDDEGEQHHFKIVGEDEADIALNTVSFASPLAKALIGNKMGDSVRWKRPAGDLNLEIITITY